MGKNPAGPPICLQEELQLREQKENSVFSSGLGPSPLALSEPEQRVGVSGWVPPEAHLDPGSQCAEFI